MSQLLFRFFIGGAVVSAFAIVGDLLKPKSFAGPFGAAPSTFRKKVTAANRLSTAAAPFRDGLGFPSKLE